MPGWAIGQQKIESQPDGAVRGRDIGGDTHRGLNVSNEFSDVTFKHVLLPIWIAAFRYKEKVYRFLVNGQTGEVVGYAPWSVWKIMGLVALHRRHRRAPSWPTRNSTNRGLAVRTARHAMHRSPRRARRSARRAHRSARRAHRSPRRCAWLAVHTAWLAVHTAWLAVHTAWRAARVVSLV